jgi:hypothetical protein
MGNITENKINQVLSAADITLFTTSIAAIASRLPAVTLTDEQRATGLSIDVDNKIFVEDCITEIGISGTGILPPFISAANLQNDYTLFNQCDALEGALENLLQKVNDIKRIAADESMTTALVVYRTFDIANTAGVAGAKQAYDKLKARYKNNGGGNTGGQQPKP